MSSVTLRHLHSRIGIGIILFILLFVITGLLLQHTNRFGLGSRYVAFPLAKAFYDVTIESSQNYKTQNHWVSQAGSFLYLDTIPLDIQLNGLQGVIESGNHIWVAGDNKLLVMSKQGVLVDELSVLDGLPGVVIKLGKNPSGDIIVGGLYNNWRVNEDLTDWSLHKQASVTWSEETMSASVPEQLRTTVVTHARNHLITWERLLSDLHSGRLFGNIGIVIFDLATLLLLFLSLIGGALWLKTRSFTHT